LSKTSKIVCAALAAAALALWCLAVFMAQQAAQAAGTVSVRWANGGVSPAQLARQAEYFREDGAANMPEATLWQERTGQQITDGGYNSARASVLEVFGSAGDAGGENMLVGGLPARGDTLSCAVSEQTAFDLWGSAKVLGKSVYWDGCEYFVCGVVSGADALMIVQANASDATPFTNMQLRFAEGGSREEGEAYLARVGFAEAAQTQHAQLLDGPLLGQTLCWLAFLPGAALALGIFVSLLREGLRLRRFPRLLLMYAPLAVALGGACILLMRSAGSIPARLIPTAWSDFSFWESLFATHLDNIRTWLSAPAERDITLLFNVVGTVMVLLIATMLTAAAVCVIKVRSASACVAGCLGAMGMLLVMAAAFSARGGVEISAGMWLLPCLWAVTAYGVAAFRMWLKPGEKEAHHASELEVPQVVADEVSETT